MASQVSEADHCTMCNQPMTTAHSDAHKVVELRCGHRFGQRCIEHLIKTQRASGGNKCPQCQTVAKLKHIRCVYETKLTVVDTKQLDDANRQIKDHEKEITDLTDDASALERAALASELECQALRRALWQEQERNKFLSSRNKNKSPPSLRKRAKREVEPKSEQTRETRN